MHNTFLWKMSEEPKTRRIRHSLSRLPASWGYKTWTRTTVRRRKEDKERNQGTRSRSAHPSKAKRGGGALRAEVGLLMSAARWCARNVGIGLRLSAHHLYFIRSSSPGIQAVTLQLRFIVFAVSLLRTHTLLSLSLLFLRQPPLRVNRFALEQYSLTGFIYLPSFSQCANGWHLAAA